MCNLTSPCGWGWEDLGWLIAPSPFAPSLEEGSTLPHTPCIESPPLRFHYLGFFAEPYLFLLWVAFWDLLRTSWSLSGHLGANLGLLGDVLGVSWSLFGPLGANLARLGPSWAVLGASWRRLGAILGHLGPS